MRRHPRHRCSRWRALKSARGHRQTALPPQPGISSRVVERTSRPQRTTHRLGGRALLVVLLSATGLTVASETAAAQSGPVVTDYTAGVACPEAITAGPEGALWFTQTNCPGGNTISSITTGGVVTNYAGGQGTE